MITVTAISAYDCLDQGVLLGIVPSDKGNP